MQHKTKYIMILTCVSSLCLCWLATFSIGRIHTEKFADEMNVFQLPVLNYNPHTNDLPSGKQWYYSGNARSPFPFICTCDYSYLYAETAGQGGYIICFWFFAWVYPLYDKAEWVS